MGKALEIISGQATAPSTTFTALTMNANNSLTVRNATPGSKILLLSAFSKHQTAGNFRVRSPQLHDNVQGIRMFTPAADVRPLLPKKIKQGLESQDTLIAEITGSATAGDIEIGTLLLYYDDLPGINGRFLSPQEVYDRTVDIMCVENSLATGTAGGWSGQEAINAEFDLFKANTDYALLGYNVSAICGAVRWQGSDVGNLGVGGPGQISDEQITCNWFVDLSEAHGLPLIPVFNSANKSSILLDAHQDENGVDVIVQSIFAELAA